MTSVPTKPRYPFAGPLVGTLGLLCLGLSAILIGASRGLFVADEFASRVAVSLGDPRVSSFVAGKITDALLSQRPDLTAVRPLILGSADGLVASTPFRAVARTALRSAHEAFFSKGGEDLFLSVPDVGILVQSALSGASPAVAAKIPRGLQTVVAGLPKSRIGVAIVAMRSLWIRVRWLQRGLFVAGLLLLGAAIWLYHDRRYALMRTGVGLIVVAASRVAAIATSLPAGTMSARSRATTIRPTPVRISAYRRS